MGSIAKYLTQQRHNFKSQARKLYRDPSRQNVHNLRVTNRRIRAVLWLAEQGSPDATFGKLQTSMHHLGRVLGACRELDVAIQDAARYQLVVKKLKSHRRSMKRKAVSAVRPKQRKKILRQIDSVVIWLVKNPVADLAPGIYRLRSRIDPWMKKSKIKDRDLHELRIAAKKTRYAFEAIGKPVQPLRRLQTLLGRGHDLQVLQAHLGKNKKIQFDATQEFQKARRVIKPALRFALKQLESPPLNS